MCQFVGCKYWLCTELDAMDAEMELEQDRLKVEHSLDETFVTVNETKLLDDEIIKEIQVMLLELTDSLEHDKMLLNFSEVEFLSSSFWGTLVKVHTMVREKDGELTLVNVDPTILEVFKITQLDRVLNIA